MDEILSSIGGFAIIVVIFYLILYFFNKQSSDERERKDLAKYLDNVYFDPNKSYDQNLKKILSDPKVRKQAEENRKQHYEREAAREDKQRRENIIKRTYSYKYEDVIYEIFAPYRIERRFEYQGQKWEVHEKLENEFVIHEISRILDVNIEEARRLFKEFDDNGLVDVGLGKDIHTRARKCSIGIVIYYNWDIISKSDKNFSKWIDEHPNIESVESANRRRAPYDITHRFPLQEFIKKHGDYTAEYSSTLSYIYFRGGIKAYIDRNSLGIDLESNRYRLKSVIEDIPNLYVLEDDGHYSLIRV